MRYGIFGQGKHIWERVGYFLMKYLVKDKIFWKLMKYLVKGTILLKLQKYLTNSKTLEGLIKYLAKGGIGSVLIDRPTNLPGLKHFQANFKVSFISSSSQNLVPGVQTYKCHLSGHSICAPGSYPTTSTPLLHNQVSGSGAVAPTKEDFCPSSWFTIDKAVSDPGFCK